MRWVMAGPPTVGSCPQRFARGARRAEPKVPARPGGRRRGTLDPPSSGASARALGAPDGQAHGQGHRLTEDTMTTIGRGATAHHLENVEAPGSMLTKNAAKALAVLRISTGF